MERRGERRRIGEGRTSGGYERSKEERAERLDKRR